MIEAMVQGPIEDEEMFLRERERECVLEDKGG